MGAARREVLPISAFCARCSQRSIVPDVVVGTSIGAAVGGAYVTGHLDAFEDWARSLQPRSVLGYLDIQLNGSGLIGGGKLAAELEQSIGRRLIEDLPLKFAAIATEVATGHEIWLTHGRLVEAIRASYALPGIFSPVMIGDRWLVDGALVNPVPVSAARALGAEIVIAVNLNADNFGHGGTISAFGTPPDAVGRTGRCAGCSRSGISKFFSAERTMKREFFGSVGRPGISTVMVEAFNIMQDRITRARLAGDPPDVLISPRVAKIGWFDFHRAEEIIAHGRRAAERTHRIHRGSDRDSRAGICRAAAGPPAKGDEKTADETRRPRAERAARRAANRNPEDAAVPSPDSRAAQSAHIDLRRLDVVPHRFLFASRIPSRDASPRRRSR